MSNDTTPVEYTFDDDYYDQPRFKGSPDSSIGTMLGYFVIVAISLASALGLMFHS